MQIFMQIYSKYPDLGSMLQLGDYAAYMQQHAATCAFQVDKPLLLVSNTKISLNFQKIMHNKGTVYQLSDMLHIKLICSN